MNRFVIACGGTGGHLAPGIALAEWLHEQGHSALLLISDKRIDARLTEKYPDLEFAVVPGAPLVLSAVGLIRFGYHQIRGLLFSWQLVLRERPVAIIGFGGFTTASIIVAGWVRGVPVALHEANRVVGRAVRTLARFAHRIYLPRGVSLAKADRRKLRHAGLPVRREIKRLPRGEAAEVFGLDATKPTVVVLGGSQGARALNQWADRIAPELALRGVQLLAVTGPQQGEATREQSPGPDGQPIWTVRIPFCENMAALYSVGDLVVSRSGAGTLAELMRCRVPAVLVPYPHAADGHQDANAREFARQGGGQLIIEDEIARLDGIVFELIGDESQLAEMRAQIGHMQWAAAEDLLRADIEVLAGLRSVGDTFAPWGMTSRN